MTSLSMSSIKYRNNVSILETIFSAVVKTMMVETRNVFVGQLGEKDVKYVMLPADNN